MFPPKGSGLEQIIKMLEARYPDFSLAKLAEATFRQYKTKKPSDIRPINIPNPVQSLQKLQTTVQSMVSGLTSSLSQITGLGPKEDYMAIARKFLPLEGRLVKPQFPVDSGEILLADIDGDSQNEMIASYRLGDSALRTMVLKKRKDDWTKIAEIINPDFEEIHYRNMANITGNGKQQLVLGLASKGKTKTLHGYSLEAEGAKKLFSRNYHKLEALGLPGQNTSLPRTQFALWNENNDETYDIEVMDWDGIQLASADSSRYYSKKVLPYYIRQLKQNPVNTSNWYQLADALAKAGANKEAIEVINSGMKRDRSFEYADKFQTLKNRL